MGTKLLLASMVAVLTLNCVSLVSGQHARSFHHFHGPVSGKAKRVSYVDKHGHRHKDYVAKPHYEFAYGVEDKTTGDYHGHKEQRDGKLVTGEYSLREPTGNIRTVQYQADEDGFRAVVHNSQSNVGDPTIVPKAVPVAVPEHIPVYVNPNQNSGNNEEDDDDEEEEEESSDGEDDEEEDYD